MPRSDKPAGAGWSTQEVAAEFGLSANALRYFEARGLIAPRHRDNGEAIYGARDRLRLEVILKGRRLGFTLDEIGELIAEHTS